MTTANRSRGAARCTECGRVLAVWLSNDREIIWMRELLDDRLERDGMENGSTDESVVADRQRVYIFKYRPPFRTVSNGH